MLSSSLTTLVLLVAGLALAAVLVDGLAPGRPAPRRRVLVALAVTFAALAALMPSTARQAVLGLSHQRSLNAGLAEITAQERCLHDIQRPDLVPAVAFARERIPEDARYRLVTNSQVVACVALNLMPRLPAPRDDFDPARDWTIHDRSVPARVRERAAPEHVFGDDFVLEPPEAG